MTSTTAGVLAVLGARPAPAHLRATCEAAIRHIPCGLDGCGACAGLACDGENGVHVVRLGAAMKHRIITGGQLTEALQSALVFVGATIIRPDGAATVEALEAGEDADLAALEIVYNAGKDAARHELGLPSVHAAGTPGPRHLHTVRGDR